MILQLFGLKFLTKNTRTVTKCDFYNNHTSTLTETDILNTDGHTDTHTQVDSSIPPKTFVLQGYKNY